jgi:hypothetical protein
MSPTVFIVKGRINRESGYSDAYREAVLGGYQGTQDEWIAGIKARVKAGEKVPCAEFNALLDYNRRMRYMKG